MENARTLELMVECYFTDDEIDINKILKDSLLEYIKKELEKSSDKSS